MSAALNRLLQSLELAGCQPWQAGVRRWFARCPTCRLEGRDSLIEIRASELGIVVCCVDAHESREAVA